MGTAPQETSTYEVSPYHQTTDVLAEAYVRCRTHYLDVSAELEIYLLTQEMSEAAKKAGVMLLPGCGGSVAMLRCLAAYAKRQMARPLGIDIALHVAGSMSRGSAISAAASATTGYSRLEDGKLVRQDAAHQAIFDFADGRGPVFCILATLPNLITVQASTGCDTVQTFVNLCADAFPSGDPASLPDGPATNGVRLTRYAVPESWRCVQTVNVRKAGGRAIAPRTRSLRASQSSHSASVSRRY